MKLKESYRTLSFDSWCALALAAFFASILFQSLSGAEVVLFPKWLSIGGLAMAVLCFVTANSKTMDMDRDEIASFGVSLIISALFYVMMIVAPSMGFFSALLVIALTIYGYLEHCSGNGFRQCWKRVIIASLITIAVLYLVFKILLKIPVPTGFLF